MSTLTLTKNYADSTILFADDFDVWLTELETFINTTKLTDDNIQDAGLTASTIIADSTISTSLIASSAITAAKIADDTVISTNITAANVTTAKLATDAVTTAKLAADAVTTAKITDSVITRSKFYTANYTSATQSPNPSTVSATTTATTVAGLTATITTSGKPVEIRVFPTTPLSTTQPGSFSYTHDSTNSIYPIIEVLRDSTVVLSAAIDRTLGSLETVSTSYLATIGPIIDTPSAGTYTYYVKFRNNSATGLGSRNQLTSRDMCLFVREL